MSFSVTAASGSSSSHNKALAFGPKPSVHKHQLITPSVSATKKIELFKYSESPAKPAKRKRNEERDSIGTAIIKEWIPHDSRPHKKRKHNSSATKNIALDSDSFPWAAFAVPDSLLDTLRDRSDCSVQTGWIQFQWFAQRIIDSDPALQGVTPKALWEHPPRTLKKQWDDAIRVHYTIPWQKMAPAGPTQTQPPAQVLIWDLNPPLKSSRSKKGGSSRNVEAENAPVTAPSSLGTVRDHPTSTTFHQYPSKEPISRATAPKLPIHPEATSRTSFSWAGSSHPTPTMVGRKSYTSSEASTPHYLQTPTALRNSLLDSRLAGSPAQIGNWLNDPNPADRPVHSLNGQKVIDTSEEGLKYSYACHYVVAEDEIMAAPMNDTLSLASFDGEFNHRFRSPVNLDQTSPADFDPEGEENYSGGQIEGLFLSDEGALEDGGASMRDHLSVDDEEKFGNEPPNPYTFFQRVFAKHILTDEEFWHRVGCAQMHAGEAT